jgi:hypothetical protein
VGPGCQRDQLVFDDAGAPARLNPPRDRGIVPLSERAQHAACPGEGEPFLWQQKDRRQHAAKN